MNVLSLIILNIIAPVFILIGTGAFLQRKFKFDLSTLSKICMVVLLPVVSFENVYKSNIGGDLLLHIFLFLLLQNACLIAVSSVISRTAKFDRTVSSTFKNSMVLNNSGNFGLPVSQLVFAHNPLGASIQVLVMMFQSILTHTYGFMTASAATVQGFKAVKQILKNPVLFALALGWMFHILAVDIPFVLWHPIENISNAFIAVALITLGAQSAFLNLRQFSMPLVLSLAGRLILSPCIALVIILLLGLEGITAQALFIASSFPSSRNSALFALEYGNHPEYAAQAVIMSTLFSSITVTAVVYLSKVLFG